MKGLLNLGIKASAVLFTGAMLVACSNEKDPGLEFAPDMYHSIPLDPYSQVKENLYNPGGMNMREPVQGTVARGKMGYNMYLSKDEAEVAGVELKNPLEYNDQHLAEGQVLYTRFCASCHGDQGDGQGLVGQKFKGVPSYSAGRVAELPAGHIYHVITNGRGRMMPHGSQVNPTERWKIVMYVQQLQGGEAPAPAADETETTEESGTTPNN
ncbi:MULTISPECIES: cytochrome c [Pontibacter]|uniref:Quinol:cytochrome c oxidoreductase monoheme cytochrome subunit n=1 Tax=Pontibacter lucknowensis TaxID=1077936 RepID=A0A1N6SYW4_9BACT|nr:MULTISPECIES: cytochrome c [Pontibacter]EJF11568.1 cytochrome c class I [Pontibacter sp. BAB1700]SIQ46260.1 quinol:cytochrome c oxidoreductase monoheme cytochrome subunit [Pontibacter lucknowensis]